jgi:CRP-like cAMP-binding protein
MLANAAIRTDTLRRKETFRMGAPDHHNRVAPRQALAQSMQLMGAIMSYARNTEIFGENEPAEYVYLVISGAVRTYKILNDGRRKIGSFYFEGDIVGLQFEDTHSLSAEAVNDAKVLVVKRSAMTGLAARDSSVGQEMFALASRELRRAQGHVVLLVKSAQERVASFLLEMAHRRGTGDVIELPMSRQDIADYLGLTIETISRTLTGLEGKAAIDVPNARRVVLRDRTALRRLDA